MAGRGNSSRAKRAPIEVVDVFCGAGGLSLGLREAGLQVVAGIDLDPACAYPFEHNIGAPFIKRDVMSLSGSDIAPLFGDKAIRVLAGCAPCQPFSGYTTKRRAADDRWQLLFEFLRLVREVQPDILTLENVPRLTLLPLWSDFVAGLEQMGYFADWSVLDVADFEVPQSRKRVVLLASKLGAIELPRRRDAARRTVRSTIEMLPAIEAGQASPADALHATRALTPINLERIRVSDPGRSWKDWPADLRVACHREESGRTYPSVYGRMLWDQPAPTMTTQFYGFGNGRFGHPEQDRAISLREGALLQSFPPNFSFLPSGKRVNFREIGKLIGNAVPPKLAQAIGDAIVHHTSSSGSTRATG